MKKLFLLTFLFLFAAGFVSVFAPSQSDAQGLVPCGGAGQPSCNFCHIFELIQRILNVFLFPIVPVIAALLFAIGGFLLFAAAGSPANLGKAKTIFFATIIGLLIVYGSWLFIEMLLDSLGFVSFGGVGEWWKVECTIPIPVVVPPPFAHWKFDEGIGITANDSAPGGVNDATLAAAPADPAWVAGGKLNGALQFDGFDDRVNLPLTLGNEPKFTVSVWINPTAFGESVITGDVNPNLGFAMGLQGGGAGGAVVTYKYADLIGGWENLYADVPSNPLNSWHQLTFTYDDVAVVKAKLYYDGVSTPDPPGPCPETPIGSGPAQSICPKRFGVLENWRVGEGYLRPFDGLIDEVKIWKQALTDEQVLAEFNSAP